MEIKKLFTLIAFIFIPFGALGFEESAIIYNSTIEAEQQIALGIRKEGQMGAAIGSIVKNSGQSSNLGGKRSTGIAYKFDGSKSEGYLSGWYDATTPGCLCEGWGAGFVDRVGRRTHGKAAMDNPYSGPGIKNIEVKSFVFDETSISSTVWIKDSIGQAVLEVTHRFGPAAKAPGAMFQALVTMTNISGDTLKDLRYNRTMDWDVPPTEFNEYVTIKGAAASAASTDTPKILYSGDYGFMTPNPFNSSSFYGSYLNRDVDRGGPTDHGFTATFKLGDLLCGEAHTFMIYYGAAADRPTMEAAFDTEDVPLYSIGESADRDRFGNRITSDVSYGFGFKGLSGSAIAPSLPTKTASLPGGIETDEDIVQTYALPVTYYKSIYQAIFKFRKEKQWYGDIKKYSLGSDGSIGILSADTAASRLKNAIGDGRLMNPYTDEKGRSIWTVGNDPNCPAGLLEKTSNNNNLTFENLEKLEKLFYNCKEYTGSPALGPKNLIRFVRGADIHNEDSGGLFSPRFSILGDTFHSEITFVGPPKAEYNSDVVNYGKSESYFRSVHGYGSFSQENNSRRPQLYVGANDGMLHAFDEDLNERWAFIPPSVTPKLKEMLGVYSNTKGEGKSNSVFNVDGPISVKDIYIHASKEWKTVLIGGLGYGGKSYYVLDITDPDEPKHMFTISNNDDNKTVNYWAADGTKSSYPYLSAPEHIDYQKLGDTWSRPSIMLLPYKSVDGEIKQRWTMVFGGGYGGGASSGFGPYVFVLDFEPDTSLSPSTSGGKIISAIPITPDPSSNIPNGVTADMSVVTSDADELADYYGGIAYFTDLQGQLWKYNLSKNDLNDNNDNLFELNLAYRAEGTLANDRFGYNQVATTIVKNDVGASSLFNYFGTGNLSRIQGRDSTINNRIFGIRDSDFPSYGLTITGTGKNAASDDSQNIDDENCVTDITQNWYSNTSSKTTLEPNKWTKVIGRAGLNKGSIFFSIYRPEDLACPRKGSGQVIKISDGCGGVSHYNLGEGLITAPVVDKRGNIYVGVSNLPKGSKVGGEGTDNITRIVESGESIEGTDWKSWQEITY